MQGHRHDQDEERRPRPSRECTDGGEPERSWRDQGDGGYYEPSRGRWDDDRRYTGSRQDPSRSDSGPKERAGARNKPKSGSRLP